MSILLSDLVDQLEADAPAREGVPSADQYERMVKEAVRDFGRRAGRVKRSTIEVVSGTASYALPADFLKLIRLHSIVAGEDGIIVSSEGLIPVSPHFKERYTILNGEITFYPTPTYTLTRYYSYKAAWALTEDDYGDYYDELTEEESEICLLKAKSAALELQANTAAGDGWRYQIGDEMLDKSGQQGAYKTRLEAAENAYLAAVQNYIGNTGMAG